MLAAFLIASASSLSEVVSSADNALAVLSKSSEAELAAALYTFSDTPASVAASAVAASCTFSEFRSKLGCWFGSCLLVPLL